MALGTLFGSLLGLSQGLFGTGSNQQATSQSRIQFRPEDLQAILNQSTEVRSGTQGLLDQLRRSQETITKNYVLPTGGFQFGTPDALTSAIAAQGSQGLMQQAAAQRQALAQQFRGQPGINRALQSQMDIQTRLQQNPLLFQAFQQQQARELAQAQQQQAQLNAANQALLQREQALTGFNTTGLGAQQNLLDILSKLGQEFGTKVSTGSQTGRSNGLFTG